MKLDDNEIRDITRYLEEGKPLPEKYRFILFEDKREVELVWNGKTNEICKVVLPFQVIEQVDEPRAEKDLKIEMDLFDMDNRGRQLKGWTNKLIWGDNKLILSSLKNGPLRDEIERNGGIKLIYIDPPFDVGADFSMDIEIGEDTFTKAPNVLEELAYRDTWGKGADSFIAMIYERLVLMRELLADDGSIYVHCDWRVNSYIRLIMDEIFAKSNHINEIVWCYTSGGKSNKMFSKKHDTIFFYSKSAKYIFNENEIRIPYSEKTLANYKEGLKGSSFTTDVKLNEQGKIPEDYWNIAVATKSLIENIGYPTQKPQKLLERIIKASSNPGDIVADFFCGSGTTLAVAEKLGRKWIGSDLGKFAIHTARKRMIGVQRELKKQNEEFRAFEILNLGKYERQHYIGINPNLREAEQERQIEQREKDFLNLILHAYRAEEVNGFRAFHGKKNNRLIAIGPINLPVSRLFIEEIIVECLEKHLTRVDVLAFEFEMGLFPHIQEEARKKGVDLALKYIPRDVFDKRAIEKNQVVFHDISYIEIKPHIKKNSLAVELTDFSVFYNQDSIANAESTLKNGGKKLVVENGQIIRVAKNKKGIVTREVLTKKWTDWIDYWAVDFDFESKKEFIRIPKGQAVQQRLDGSHEPEQLELGEYEEIWTGDYVFENEWQSFRTKKDRSLELISVSRELMPGRRKVAVKVVDIFGNDTMKVIEISI